MRHGQWVAFEGEQQHRCDEQPPDRAAPSIKPTRPRPADKSAEPFEPLYPKVPGSPTSGSDRPLAEPSPTLGNSPTTASPAPPPRPAPAPRPTPPRGPGSPIPNDVTPTPRPTPAPHPPTATRGATEPTRLGPAPGARPGLPQQQPATAGKPSKLSPILALVSGLLGSTFGLAFAALALLSLPLNVLAVMHLTGWSWFTAIIGVVFFSCIPVVGQLGYLILAIMGAYYLWNANFDWQRAAFPSAQTFSVSTLSETELERFKADVVRPGFEQACKSEALKSNSFDGKLPVLVARRCECFATNFAKALARDDLMAFEKSGRYPDELQQRLGPELRRACQN
jgi:hypothetical protein